jgi:hypothetical protein
MDSSHPLELLAVLVCYLLAFAFVIGPAIESVTGLETLSAPGYPGSFERTWELVSKPQGWLLCLGYVLTHFTYLSIRARLAGESVDDYWE